MQAGLTGIPPGSGDIRVLADQKTNLASPSGGALRVLSRQSNTLSRSRFSLWERLVIGIAIGGSEHAP